MMKLKVLNLKNFLHVVNSCSGQVSMRYPDGRSVNINGYYIVQNRLWELYRENGNCLSVTIEVNNPKDYMSIVSYYAGDC